MEINDGTKPRGRPAQHTLETVQLAYDKLGSYVSAAQALGYANASVVHNRLKHSAPAAPIEETYQHGARVYADVQDGMVIVGSDAHIWPGNCTTAMLGFLWAIEKFQPALVVLNGDVFDGAKVGRFPSIGWEQKPTVVEEIVACQTFLRDLRKLSPGARHMWTLGNHDLRFESFIAKNAPEFAGIHGVHLQDHFPDWEPSWSIWVNPNSHTPCCIKHRWKGGIHARHGNTLNAGIHMVTGHLHSLGVTPWTDYRGDRYGVDTGTLASPGGPQFIHYTEDNPVNWRSGFAVLTFHGGNLMVPELVKVFNEKGRQIEFRGQVIQL